MDPSPPLADCDGIWETDLRLFVQTQFNMARLQ